MWDICKLNFGVNKILLSLKGVYMLPKFHNHSESLGRLANFCSET